MKNNNIAAMLRYYRRLNQYTVNQVSDILKEYKIVAAPKTIYAWENGTSQPKAETLMLLCELYGIENVLETFGYSKSKIDDKVTNLTVDEKNLINQYRMHPEMHIAVRKLLDLLEKPEKDS